MTTQRRSTRKTKKPTLGDYRRLASKHTELLQNATYDADLLQSTVDLLRRWIDPEITSPRRETVETIKEIIEQGRAK